MRLDKWLKNSRLIKRRTIANKVYQVAVDYGKRQIVYTISLDTENLIAGFYFK